MNIFKSMDISASALTAQRYRMDVVGENIANAYTTRTDNGTPYQRKVVLFSEQKSPDTFSDILNRTLGGINSNAGVRVSATITDTSEGKLVYDPTHPHANEEGYVEYPNVDTEREMVDFISASRSYEANLTVLNNFKQIALKALEIK